MSTRKYTSTVRRGIGALLRLVATSLPSSTLQSQGHRPHPTSLTYVRSLTPGQLQELTECLNYLNSEYQSELSKFHLSDPSALISCLLFAPASSAPSTPSAALPGSEPTTSEDPQTPSPESELS